MRTIIVPTNFSEESLNAVNYAADLASMLELSLTLLYMYPLSLPVSEIPVADYDLTEELKEAEQQIASLKEKISDRTGGRIRITTKVDAGDLLMQLKMLCQSLHPYAVVMAVENISVIEKFVIKEDVIPATKYLASPVIVVPPGKKFTGIRRILLACDLKEVAGTVPFTELSGLVKEFKAELHVLHVLKAGEELKDTEKKAEVRWLKDILHDLAPHYHFIHAMNIDDAITQFAEKKNVDLLVLLPKKHSLLHDIFKHSYSRGVIIHTQVPVLSIHE